MQTASFNFWWKWLIAVAVYIIVFGLFLLMFPDLTVKGFSLLVYADSTTISGFSSVAVAYIKLVHAVLGAVMIGWATLILFVLLNVFRQNPPLGWKLVTYSALAWFVPDTLYSLLSGFWQNAALNLVFAVLLAVPLMALRRHVKT